MKRLNQTGSHLIALALLVLALGVISFAGYTVVQRNKPADTASTTAQTQTKTAVVPATIKNTADLQQAGTVLDNSSSQLNTSLDDSALNADLSSML